MPSAASVPRVSNDLAGFPGKGRLYRDRVRVGIADADPERRCRLDAIARWLQDVAYADLADAGLEGAGEWVVRRNRIVVEQFPRFFEELSLETWCSGTRKICAERRTTLHGESGARAEAVTLWVNLDSETGVPRRLDESFHEVFGPSAEGGRVQVALTHPPAPVSEPRETWSFRAADLDPAGHVNNAVVWEVLEQELVGSEPVERIDAEIEHPSVASGDPARLVRDGEMRWLTDEAGETLASIRVAASER